MALTAVDVTICWLCICWQYIRWQYMDTSLIRNCLFIGPCRRTMPRDTDGMVGGREIVTSKAHEHNKQKGSVYMVFPQPCISHPTPYTIHHTPFTIHHAQYTANLQP